MRISTSNRVNVHNGRIKGGAIKLHSNVAKLAQDFSKIYMTPKIKHVKKFTLAF